MGDSIIKNFFLSNLSAVTSLYAHIKHGLRQYNTVYNLFTTLFVHEIEQYVKFRIFLGAVVPAKQSVPAVSQADHIEGTFFFKRLSGKGEWWIYDNIIRYTCIRSTGICSACLLTHYSDVTINAMVSQITSLTIVYSTVYSGADQRKHQSSASLAFVRGIHRSPANSPHKGPLTR